MKKLFVLLILFGVFIFTTSGCLKKTNDEQDEVNDSFYISDFICNEMKDITYSGTDFFINDSGELYVFSTNKKYSTTKTNCEKIESDVVFKKIIRNTLIDSKGNIYSYSDYNGLILIDKTLEEKGAAHYGINQMIIPLYRKYNDMFLLTDDRMISESSLYGLVIDKNIYLLSYDYDTESASKKSIYLLDNDESLISISNGYIKTNKGYYKYLITNKEECYEYADIDCKYGIMKIDESFNNAIYISNDIEVYNINGVLKIIDQF